jgi:hypothetical protein
MPRVRHGNTGAEGLSGGPVRMLRPADDAESALIDLRVKAMAAVAA